MPKRGENIRKRKDGRWEGRYIQRYDQNGKAKYGSVYAPSYYECKRKLLSAAQLERTKAAANRFQNISFREILFLWLSNYKMKLRPQTYAKYLDLIEKHLVPELGKWKLAQMDTMIINDFLKRKAEAGRLDGKGGLSVSSLKALSTVIRLALDFAVKERYCRDFIGDIIVPSKGKTEIDIFTVKEQLALEAYAFQNLDESKLGILLTLNTGLRIGEICGLKWSDIDFDNKSLQIKRTVQRVRNVQGKSNEPKTFLAEGEPKTESSKRIIPIPEFLMEQLKYFCERAATEYVVPGPNGAFLDPRTYQYRFDKYLKACHIRHLNFHVLRHTFATRCIEVGADVKSVSEILGHASASITLNIYVHSSLEQKRTQMQLLNTLRI